MAETEKTAMTNGGEQAAPDVQAENMRSWPNATKCLLKMFSGISPSITANVKQKILYLSENKNPPSRKQKRARAC